MKCTILSNQNYTPKYQTRIFGNDRLPLKVHLHSVKRKRYSRYNSWVKKLRNVHLVVTRDSRVVPVVV